MKVKKKELIERTAEAAGCTQVEVRRIFAAAANEAHLAVSRGESVMLFGLGKLVVKRRPPRKARHMVSGAVVMVPERAVVLYQASVSMTAAANEPTA